VGGAGGGVGECAKFVWVYESSKYIVASMVTFDRSSLILSRGGGGGVDEGGAGNTREGDAVNGGIEYDNADRGVVRAIGSMNAGHLCVCACESINIIIYMSVCIYIDLYV